MIQLAQDMFKIVQDRFRATLHAVKDLAESVGAPPTVTSLLQGLERLAGPPPVEEQPIYAPPPPTRQASPAPREQGRDGDGAREVAQEAARATPVDEGAERRRPAGKKRGAGGTLPDGVRPLDVEDAINGSTYLARIIWTLGVSDLEGTGPLRPADMARMIMSRSPVSLEPPNVARYIRRSKPTCIAIDHSEGGSSFYRLNAEGRALFNEKFKVK